MGAGLNAIHLSRILANHTRILSNIPKKNKDRIWYPPFSESLCWLFTTT